MIATCTDFNIVHRIYHNNHILFHYFIRKKIVELRKIELWLFVPTKNKTKKCTNLSIHLSNLCIRIYHDNHVLFCVRCRRLQNTRRRRTVRFDQRRSTGKPRDLQRFVRTGALECRKTFEVRLERKFYNSGITHRPVFVMIHDMWLSAWIIGYRVIGIRQFTAYSIVQYTHVRIVMTLEISVWD